ncbi:MAG: hypothetical protein HQM10_09860 [Candidatus Riflebacteria bacterium]|nr:hypothetical protein [Candidatus Riflebacteria bacterium]
MKVCFQNNFGRFAAVSTIRIYLILCLIFSSLCTGISLADISYYDAKSVFGDSKYLQDLYIEEIWLDVLNSYNISPEGVVIVVSPEKYPGIGYGLSMINFRGTVYVVEPDPSCLNEILARYRELIPNARIHGICNLLSQALSELPSNADILVAGHILEDMILEKSFSAEYLKETFTKKMSSENIEAIQLQTAFLRADKKMSDRMHNEVRTEWNINIEKLNPKLVIINWSKHREIFDNNESSFSNIIKNIIRDLNASDKMPLIVEQRLYARGQNPDNWYFNRRTGISKESLCQTLPKSVDRLGSKIFVTMDAYPVDPKKAFVAYVQNDLLHLFNGKPSDENQARDFISRNLLLSLDPADGIPGAPPVKVYVDRQADPMNMSLTENLGSGRAAYYGDRFNLKGIGKTVLAVSKDVIHSNGILDMVGGLKEMICSNVLQTNIRTGASSVLSVIDMKKQVEVPWVKQKVPGCLLIRLDDHGELDRPVHLFYRNEPVSGDRLRRFAARLGMQDAEKFIERVLHGGWSAGNVSLDAHLIDYDTVFAVHGRAPQWSYRPNWLSDFFGLEDLGQKELMKAVADHPINGDSVSLAELYKIFDKTRKNQLEQRFLDLVGVNLVEFNKHFLVHSPEIESLVQRFFNLSMKMYPNFKATAAWDKENICLSVYDFSRFFRYYPIVRKNGNCDDKTALGLIRNPHGKMKKSKETEEGGMPDDIENSLTKDFVVSSDAELKELDKQVLEFIRDYEKLLVSIDEKLPESSAENLLRAYVVNEERTYMIPIPANEIIVGLTMYYKAGKITSQQFSDFIQLIVEVSNRIPQFDAQGRCQSDARLYLNAYTTNLISRDGFYQPRLTFLHTPQMSETAQKLLKEIENRNAENHNENSIINSEDNPAMSNVKPTIYPAKNSVENSSDEFSQKLHSSLWQVKIGDVMYTCDVQREGRRTHITGPKLPLKNLIIDPIEPHFFSGNKEVKLKPVICPKDLKNAI